jgi:hypothetical protein
MATLARFADFSFKWIDKLSTTTLLILLTTNHFQIG